MKRLLIEHGPTIEIDGASAGWGLGLHLPINSQTTISGIIEVNNTQGVSVVVGKHTRQPDRQTIQGVMISASNPDTGKKGLTIKRI